MTDVQLSRKNSSQTIVTLYGNVIEYFSALNYDGGRSMHIGHLTFVGITTNTKGKHELFLTDARNRAFLHNPVNEVDDEALDKVKEWVAEVQRAKQLAAL